MKRLAPTVFLLLGLFACGKKDEPAPTPQATAPATESAPQTQPSAAVSQPEATVEATTSGMGKAALGEGMYTVVKGDNLYRIAKKHGVKQRDLAQWNKIKNPRRLRIGQQLTLTAPSK